MPLHDEKEQATQAAKVLRREAIICCEHGDYAWNAEKYKEAEAHYQDAADKIEKIALKTKSDTKSLKFYKNEVLRCQAKIFYEQGKKWFDAKDYEEAQACYQKAIDKTKQIVSKKQRDRGNLAFYTNERLFSREYDEPRLQAVICFEYGSVCYNAKQYEEAKMHFQEAVEKLETIVFKTERNKESLKWYKGKVLECEPRAFYQQGNQLWRMNKYSEAEKYYQTAADTLKAQPRTKQQEEDLISYNNAILRCQAANFHQRQHAKNYKEAEINYKAAVAIIKKFPVKTKGEEKNLKTYEDAILDCLATELAENLCQLAHNNPTLLFDAIYKLQNNLGSIILIRALGKQNAFKIIAQQLPAILPFIFECVSKADNAILLIKFIALAKKEKLSTHQLAGVMYAFQQALKKMDKASLLLLKDDMTYAVNNAKSPYHSLFLKKGFTSIFQGYGETKISIAMKNALQERLKEFSQRVNDRPGMSLATRR